MSTVDEGGEGSDPSSPSSTALTSLSAACGRNQLEGLRWPRAVSAQLSAISIGTSIFSLELLRKTQRSHRERVYPPALPPATDRTLPTAAHGVVGSPSFFSYRCW